MRLTKEQRELFCFINLLNLYFSDILYNHDIDKETESKAMQLYYQNNETIPKLKIAFSDKFYKIFIEMCQKVCKSAAGRVQNCLKNEGEHFEHL